MLHESSWSYNWNLGLGLLLSSFFFMVLFISEIEKDLQSDLTCSLLVD